MNLASCCLPRLLATPSFARLPDRHHTGNKSGRFGNPSSPANGERYWRFRSVPGTRFGRSRVDNLWGAAGTHSPGSTDLRQQHSAAAEYERVRGNPREGSTDAHDAADNKANLFLNTIPPIHHRARHKHFRQRVRVRALHRPDGLRPEELHMCASTKGRADRFASSDGAGFRVQHGGGVLPPGSQVFSKARAERRLIWTRPRIKAHAVL